MMLNKNINVDSPCYNNMFHFVNHTTAYFLTFIAAILLSRDLFIFNNFFISYKFSNQIFSQNCLSFDSLLDWHQTCMLQWFLCVSHSLWKWESGCSRDFSLHVAWSRPAHFHLDSSGLTYKWLVHCHFPFFSPPLFSLGLHSPLSHCPVKASLAFR